MTDSFPSTPLSSRTNTPSATLASGGAGAGGGSASGSRHLKRLSLSTNSAFSPSSPASPLSAAATASPSTARTPVTPGGGTGGEKRANHGVRGLRLSMSGSIPPSAGSPLGAAGSNPPTPGEERDHPLGASPAAGSTSPTLLRRSIRPGGQSLGAPETPSSSAPGSPSLDAGTPNSAAALRSSIGRSGHSRRTSSISYGPARSSLDGMSGLGLGVSVEGEEARAVSPAGRRSLDGGLGGVREEPEKEEEAPASSSLAGAAEETSLARSRSGSEGAATQATLVEQNADLLSFIAKKERKCLDLREELKRHESELALLKKKWENIVARSLQQQSAPAPYHPRNASISTVSSSASPNTSPTPRSSAILHPAHTAHSLDLSLLSSTFDPSIDMDGTVAGVETPPIEIPESVKAAGSWLGNQLGKVLDAAVGFPSPVDERATNGLESLQEVDEEAEEEGGEGDEGERSRRRESKGSSVETDFSSSVAGSRSTAPSSVASEDTVSPLQSSAAFEAPLKSSPVKIRHHSSFSTSPPNFRQLPTHRTSSLSQSQPPSAAPPPSHSAATAYALSQSHGSTSSHGPPHSHASHLSHSRSRSTALDALSGGWSSLGKKWTALSESETFKNSKRATMGLVDTFEQGLAQALGPLEPPRLDPIGGGEGEEPHSPRRRGAEKQLNPHPAAAKGEIPSPFLDSSPPTAAASSLSSATPVMVPGQGLSSVFSSWSKSTNPATASSSASSSSAHPPPPSSQHQHQHQQQQPSQPGSGSWDWSAFLPGSSSTDSGLNEAGASPVKERRRSSIVREVKGAGSVPEGGKGKGKEGKPEERAPADDEGEGEDWPAW